MVCDWPGSNYHEEKEVTKVKQRENEKDDEEEEHALS